MGLLVMILGLLLFLGVHTLTTQRELRARMIASIGEGGYKVGYALASIIGLALIVWGFAQYRATGMIEIWYPPKALKHLTEALMLPAVILVVAAYIRGRTNAEPIVMLTSYHARTAALVDRYCDVILVGDSLGNVMHGFETTVPVTLDMMILQGHAVMRGSQHALVVVDMPFGSYEASKEQAFHSAVRILKETHCGAVKLEGGARMAETIAFLSDRGVPAMGRIALTPQSIDTLGSFRAQGREEGSWEPIETDARAIAQAGAFSVVVEAVAEPLARKITESIALPTIRLGASAARDGQGLVLAAMLGL